MLDRRFTTFAEGCVGRSRSTAPAHHWFRTPHGDRCRLAGADEESAALDLAQLDLLDGIAVGADLGLAAGRLRARRYHRSRCAVSMADCIAAEAARHTSAGLATSDPHLLDLCHAEDISTTVLTASDGTRWTPPDRSPTPAP